MKRMDGGNALTESPGCWEPGRKQTVRWTAEGARNGLGSVYRNAQDTRQWSGDVLASCKGHGKAVNPRWHRG